MARHEPSDPAGALYLGLDLGTSACRACLIDGAGRERGQARAPLPEPVTRDRQVEQDAALWWDAVRGCIEALHGTADLTRLRTLAVDGTSGSLVLCDSRGRPRGPALMYNDARAEAEAARIAAVAPPDCGARGPTASLAKLLYLAAGEPAGSDLRALHQADWILGRLTGQWNLSDENNALKLGYDPARRTWPDWLDRLAVPRGWLPRVLAPGRAAAPLDPAVAATLGLSADVLAVAGTTDSTAGFLATGAARPGEAVTALGSTLVLKVLSERPVFSPQYGVYSHRLDDLWLAGGASNSGGAVLRQHFSDARLRDLSPRLRPDEPTGLDYYPLPRPGERFPVSDPELPPRLTPRPEDPARFLQGLLEAMADIEARGYRLLTGLGAPYPTRVLTVGGGADNAAWTALRRQRLQVEVTPAEHREAAYGAALLARRGARGADRP